MTAPDDVRARFEAEFSKPPFEFQMERWGVDSTRQGRYRVYHVQCAWEAYRAAHADLSGEVRELVEAARIVERHKDRLLSGNLQYVACGDFATLFAALAKFTQEKP